MLNPDRPIPPSALASGDRATARVLAAYRRRIERLTGGADAAAARDDLTAELRRWTVPAGRARPFADGDEPTRTLVQKAIKRDHVDRRGAVGHRQLPAGHDHDRHHLRLPTGN